MLSEDSYLLPETKQKQPLSRSGVVMPAVGWHPVVLKGFSGLACGQPGLPVQESGVRCATITRLALAYVVNYASGRWITESSLLITAPTPSERARPAAVRLRSPASMVRTR